MYFFILLDTFLVTTVMTNPQLTLTSTSGALRSASRALFIYPHSSPP